MEPPSSSTNVHLYSHAIAEYTNNLDHQRRNPEADNHFSQNRVVYGDVCLLQVDGAHVQCDTARPSQLLRSAFNEHRVGGRPLAQESALFSRHNPGLPAKRAKPIWREFEENFTTMHNERDARIVTTLGLFLGLV